MVTQTASFISIGLPLDKDNHIRREVSRDILSHGFCIGTNMLVEKYRKLYLLPRICFVTFGNQHVRREVSLTGFHHLIPSFKLTDEHFVERRHKIDRSIRFRYLIPS